ncbi:unnamed protein product [Closterium sp. NIES-54]
MVEATNEVIEELVGGEKRERGGKGAKAVYCFLDKQLPILLLLLLRPPSSPSPPPSSSPASSPSPCSRHGASSSRYAKELRPGGLVCRLLSLANHGAPRGVRRVARRDALEEMVLGSPMHHV